MFSDRIRIATTAMLAVALSCLGLAATTVPAGASPSRNDGPSDRRRCSPGARTLAAPGSRLYPETGNGGYRSIHTNITMVYDDITNRFLPGNQVELIQQATQCLSSFSLDFERISADTVAGPDLTIGSVTVNGRPATFAFVQPTYPGDPAGQDDPDPAAHQVSQTNPVGGPLNNPLPPACSPSLPTTDAALQNSQNGDQCPANKLVITPVGPIRRGEQFNVTIGYTGRPGVHHDGDGTTEGWFRASGGGFVTTEPVGSQAWMPLNNFPTAKPTYDFFNTVAVGRTSISNGILVSTTPHTPNAQFPSGSATWHWTSEAPIASYLVHQSVGDFTLTSRTGADGVIFYAAQDNSIPAEQQTANLAIMNLHEDIIDYQSQTNGPYPFTSAGIVIGTADASFEEEMQTMITFAGGEIDTSVLYHENMHQWWGDNVSEASYNMTFFKEGLASLSQAFFTARTAELAAGGPTTVAGNAAFEASLVAEFNAIYAGTGSIWTGAPSNPTTFTFFSGGSTYTRPEAAYIALRLILGPDAFNSALQRIQRRYGNGNITEAELEAAFRRVMPNKSRACTRKLNTFFTQWFDTAYPASGGVDRPQITGPGLTGPGFFDANGRCS